ncbi:hypothetical protein HK105_204287 [Polyrhizophydium stewartii]|uniref:3,4-dihydroxy-2-butanone-4-phosphate synthase n=1 Tax=Polyrhizophydium stewartii TaxID=2732419 RepID=A0ABR4N9I3_9FUNG|nr:hypothetical protein HK105_007477 [Polyrhizophydium stewartii]
MAAATVPSAQPTTPAPQPVPLVLDGVSLLAGPLLQHVPSARLPIAAPAAPAPAAAVRVPAAGLLAMPAFAAVAVHAPAAAHAAADPAAAALFDVAALDVIALLEDAVPALVRAGCASVVAAVDHSHAARLAAGPLAAGPLAHAVVALFNSPANPLVFEGHGIEMRCNPAATAWTVERPVPAPIAVMPLGAAADVSALLASGTLVASGSVVTGAASPLGQLGLALRSSSHPNAAHLLKRITIDAAAALGIRSAGPLAADAPASDLVLVRARPHWKDIPAAMLAAAAASAGPEIAAVFKSGHLIYSDAAFEHDFKTARLAHYYHHDNLPSAVPSVPLANGYANGHTANGHTANGHADNSHADNGHAAAFDSIESALDAFRRGEFLVVVDNEDRENEGDLIIAGEDFTPEKAAFMIRYTSGLICAPATGEILDALELPLMVPNNTDSLKTAYTITIDVKKGTTTGISAADRSATVKALARADSAPADFTRPGHVLPLRAVEGGVLKRVGHTEAAVDLCRLSGKRPVSAICEIVLDDGRMARRDDLRIFANKFNLKMITIHDLVQYRLKHGL